MARQTDPSLTHYITAAHAYPELSREDEHALTVRWLTQHDEVAREELVRAHLRYVVSIAFKYHRYGLPLAITEVHMGCTREEQMRWLQQAWRDAVQARDEGIDLSLIHI